MAKFENNMIKRTHGFYGSFLRVFCPKESFPTIEVLVMAEAIEGLLQDERGHRDVTRGCDGCSASIIKGFTANMLCLNGGAAEF